MDKIIQDHPDNLSEKFETPFASYLELLSEHSCMCITNIEGIIVFANNQFCIQSGYLLEDLIGATYEIISANKNNKIIYQDFIKTTSAESNWKGIICHRAKDNSLYWAKKTVTLIRSKNGLIDYYIYLSDIITTEINTQTQLKQVETDLIQKRESLQAKNTALTEILSHQGKKKQEFDESIQVKIEKDIYPEIDALAENNPEILKYLEHLKQNLREISNPTLQDAKELFNHLTHKELQICHFFKLGLSVKEIAAHLHVSIRTIEKHRENINKKIRTVYSTINIQQFFAKTSP